LYVTCIVPSFRFTSLSSDALTPLLARTAPGSRSGGHAQKTRSHRSDATHLDRTKSRRNGSSRERAMPTKGSLVRLEVSREGALIDNTWRSYEHRWSEINGVGIRQAGCFPQPVLWFRLVGRSPVVAQASPLRRSVRQEFQTKVLSFAPASVRRLEDEVSASWPGTDSAPSYRLRLWWLKKYPNGRWARFLDQLGS